MSLLARRYAVALFALADKAGVADQVGNDLAGLHTELSTKVARALLCSPELPAAERGVVLEKLGHGRHQLVRNLIGVLEHRRRLEVLFDLHTEFHSLLLARRGEIEGQVECARPVDDAQLAQLAAMASRLTGKKVSLTAVARPELLGGVRLRVGNVLYDGSMQSALEQLEQKLLQASV